MGRPPALARDHVLDDRRPYGAGEIIPGRRHRHRDPAPDHEPVRNVRHQRSERGRAAEADQHVSQRELPDIRRVAGGDVADADASRADHDGNDNSEAVGEPAQDNAAQSEADHGEGEGQRRVGAQHAEIGLHRGQRDHHRPHADRADGAHGQRDAEPEPRGGGVRLAGACYGMCGGRHGAGTSSVFTSKTSSAA